jgi:hypothetical protein
LPIDVHHLRELFLAIALDIPMPPAYCDSGRDGFLPSNEPRDLADDTDATLDVSAARKTPLTRRV